MTSVLAFLVALAVSLAATPVVRFLARRHGFIARPKEDRWHRRPTALLGGIPVFLATLAAVLVYGSPSPAFGALAGAAVVVFLTGLVDDLTALRPATKLALQIGAASVAVWGGVSLGWMESLTLDSLLTIFWLIGITNAFNLIDNMDGACAGVGAIAAGVVALIGSLTPAGAALGSIWAAALAGALLGFLVYNFHPASIFLGDSGSLFIGFVLAGVSCMAGETSGSARYWLGAVPVLVLAVPIFDTTLVTVARKLSRRPASVGGTDHTAHRLVRLGFTEKRAVLVLYTLSLLSGIAALALVVGSSGSDILVVGLVLALALLTIVLLGVRVYGGDDFSLVVGGRLRALAIDFLLRRHVLEVLLDVVLVAASYYVSYRLRFEPAKFAIFFPTFLQTLPIVIASQVLSLLASGAYGRIWRYFSFTDVLPLAKGVALGSGVSILILVYLYRFENLSRGVLLINALLLVAVLAASRMVFRVLPEIAGGDDRTLRRAVVYGAGDAGDMLVRELSNNSRYGFKIVGFIDDDANKAGRRVRGVPVLGPSSSIADLLGRAHAEAVILSSAMIEENRVGAVLAACERSGISLLRFRVVLEDQRPMVAACPAEVPRVTAGGKG